MKSKPMDGSVLMYQTYRFNLLILKDTEKLNHLLRMRRRKTRTMIFGVKKDQRMKVRMREENKTRMRGSSTVMMGWRYC